MATRGNYKTTKRQPRILDAEDLFNLGMSYVESPLIEGQVKCLINYDILDFGEKVRPRGGLEKIDEKDIGAIFGQYYIHHTSSMYVEDKDNSDAYLRRYVLLGVDNVAGGITYNSSRLLIDNDDGTYTVATYDTRVANPSTFVVRYSTNDDWTKLHGMDLAAARPHGLHINAEHNTYILWKDGAATGLGRLKAYIEAGTLYHSIEKITPRPISPHQAINYGYNMMSDSPFTFTNEQNVLGIEQLLGVLPRDKDGNLKFDAQVGEDIEFELIYSYPANAPTYKVQWEVNNLATESGVDIIADVTASGAATYNPGDPIKQFIRIPYEQFSVIVKLFDSTDLAKPLKATTLSSYYLTKDSKNQNKNLEPINYDLATADGVATFMKRTILWGVKGAENVMFSSDANNPGYFPFPQGTHPFDSNIIHIVPFMDKMLVFTEDKLVAAEYNEETRYYNIKSIQENLMMTREDRNTICVVKNMVYFKSGNYYYMVVPNLKAGVGELQVAPISRPIERMLDTFKYSVETILDEMYDIRTTLSTGDAEWTVALQDYYNYLDTSQIKNVYVFKLTFNAEVYYMEMSLNYDTIVRSWSAYVYQTNGRRMLPYRNVSTDSTIYINLYNNASFNGFIQFIQKSTLNVTDTFELDLNGVRKLDNNQFIDTGKRAHSKDFKKKFRSIEFVINNLEGERLEFFTEFMIDDATIEDFFQYEVKTMPTANPDEALLYVDRTYQDPHVVPGKTELGAWVLSESTFPENTVVKVRGNVIGKGYSGRLKILSKNQHMYELLNFNWVYRMMNAR